MKIKLNKWHGFAYARGAPMRLLGIVSGDPRFTDGVPVITSPVQTMFEEDGNLTAITVTGTRYTLGTPASEVGR